MNTIIKLALAAATALAGLALVAHGARADGLYVRPDGIWRAMPPPTYCCSCVYNPTPCGYGRGPPPAYGYDGPPGPPYYGNRRWR
jgi:hypothetical protein